MAPYLNGGVFLPTGETLGADTESCVADRPRGKRSAVVDDNTRVPLYLSTAGWATLNVRSGHAARRALAGHGSRRERPGSELPLPRLGIDSPGASAYLAVVYRF